MEKSANEIEATVKEIYAIVKDSATPMSVLSLQTTVLIAKGDWLPSDI